MCELVEAIVTVPHAGMLPDEVGKPEHLAGLRD